MVEADLLCCRCRVWKQFVAFKDGSTYCRDCLQQMDDIQDGRIDRNDL